MNVIVGGELMEDTPKARRLMFKQALEAMLLAPGIKKMPVTARALRHGQKVLDAYDKLELASDVTIDLLTDLCNTGAATREDLNNLLLTLRRGRGDDV